MPRFLSVKQVAEQLAVSEKTIRKLIVGSELEAYKVGGLLRVPETALLEYLQRSKVKKHDAPRRGRGRKSREITPREYVHFPPRKA